MVPGERAGPRQTDFFNTTVHASHSNNYGICLFYVFLKLFTFGIIRMPTLLFAIVYYLLIS